MIQLFTKKKLYEKLLKTVTLNFSLLVGEPLPKRQLQEHEVNNGLRC